MTAATLTTLLVCQKGISTEGQGHGIFSLTLNSYQFSSLNSETQMSPREHAIGLLDEPIITMGIVIGHYTHYFATH